LKVDRCTLNGGRQRAGAQRRCACTGGSGGGEGDEGLKVDRCTLNGGRQRAGRRRQVRPRWVTPQYAGQPTGVVHPPGGDRHIRRDHRCASRPPPITAWPVSRRTIPANRLSGTHVVRRAHTTRRRCNVARRRGVQRAALRCHQA